MPCGKGDRKGRPYRIAWPQVYRAAFAIRRTRCGGAAAKRTPHDDIFSFFERLLFKIPVKHSAFTAKDIVYWVIAVNIGEDCNILKHAKKRASGV